MSVIYNDALKTARMQVMSDMVAGKTPAAATGTATAGQLVIGTASLSGATGVLAAVALAIPPFVISGTGTVVATLQGVPLSVVATGTGTAAKAELRNNAGVTVCSGLVVGTSGSGAEVILTTTDVTAGQTVTIVSVSTITHG